MRAGLRSAPELGLLLCAAAALPCKPWLQLRCVAAQCSALAARGMVPCGSLTNDVGRTVVVQQT